MGGGGGSKGVHKSIRRIPYLRAVVKVVKTNKLKKKKRRRKKLQLLSAPELQQNRFV